MCGIASIFVYDPAAPAVDEKELLKIRETMVKRGPDGAGIWISPDKRVGLAHRRLAIIDLSDFGAQPMADRTGQLHIVFNGEIYNFRALRSQLEKKGYQFRSNSDTEVLLYLYAEKGQEMVHDLRGMYTFALWDNGRKTLFLARDPFGIKPLYYSDDGRTIRIASQVKALLKAANVDTSAEPAGQVGFFLWGSVPEPYTLYRKIKALPAGSTLSIDSFGKKKITLFCDIAQGPIPASPAKTNLNRIEQLHDADKLVLRVGLEKRIVQDPMIISGTLLFLSKVPVPGICSGGGYSMVYSLGVCDGEVLECTWSTPDRKELNMPVPVMTPEGEKMIFGKSGAGAGDGRIDKDLAGIKIPKGIYYWQEIVEPF